MLSSRAFGILAAPAMQDTSYPAPPTQAQDTGYPAQNTATGGTNTPGPSTVTPGTIGTQTPGSNQTQPAQTLTLPSGTQQSTPTAGNDIFLTENAEMGQSSATPLPTETPSPTPTKTLTATMAPLAPTIFADQGFTMNWGAFTIGFFVMIILGGVAWFMYTRRVLFSKD